LSVVRNWTLICEHLCRWVVEKNWWEIQRKLILVDFPQLEPFRSRLRAWMCISGSSSRSSIVGNGKSQGIQLSHWTSEWIVWNAVR
jgi:hypothetical protein